MENPKEEKSLDSSQNKGRVKFKVHGEELLEKTVKLSGRNGRIYLPQDWIDRKVKIIRVD
jgi:putative transposon-encoded protein